MIEYTDALHYGSIVSVVTLTSLGAGIGEGIAGSAALLAMNKQPAARADIAKTTILGMALVETAAVIGIIMSLMLLAETRTTINAFYTSLAHVGIGLALGIPGIVIGYASSLPAREACHAIARQPFFSQYIARFMLVTQSIIQTPAIFGFIVAMFIKNQAAYTTNLYDSIRLICCGAAIGLGSIGPSFGLAIFARVAGRGLGVSRDSYQRVFSFTFISNAIIESSAIFALIISLMLLNMALGPDQSVELFKVIGATFAISLGTLGPGISSGKTAAAACEQIIKNPSLYGLLSKLSMFTQGMIDTCAIYALLISLLLIIRLG